MRFHTMPYTKTHKKAHTRPETKSSEIVNT